MSDTTADSDAKNSTKSDHERTGGPNTASAGRSTADVYTYGCPYCETAYSDERLTRVHITRATDAAHQNRHGLMPEEKIEKRDAEGTVVKTISRRPKEIALEELRIEDFPTELSDKRRHALVVASHHPDEDNCSELTELLRQRLVDGPFDTEPPTERTVRNALDAFYHPHESQDATTEQQTLADLTGTQQAIGIARIVCPETSNQGLADLVGCAKSYPGMVLRDNPDLFAELEARLDAGESPETIIADELSSEMLKTLHEEGLVADVPIDITELLADGAADDTQASEDATSAESDTTAATHPEEIAATNSKADSDPQSNSDSNSNSNSSSQWGSPIEHHGIMQATPSNPFTPVSTDGFPADGTQRTLSTTEATTETEAATEATPETGDGTEDESTTTRPAGDEPPEEDAPPDAGNEPTRPNGNGTDLADRWDEWELRRTSPTGGRCEASQPAERGILAELQTLQAKVEFFRQTVSPVAQPDGTTALLESFAEQVEQHCEAIRQAQTES